MSAAIGRVDTAAAAAAEPYLDGARGGEPRAAVGMVATAPD